ncbi:SDR family oxidoreductase [Dyella humicola]|uniref:SDR family oxidoreductase n=1 Tax=Dyella humicola TaxID=2992126 RepID=UPI00225370ED
MWQQIHRTARRRTEAVRIRSKAGTFHALAFGRNSGKAGSGSLPTDSRSEPDSVLCAQLCNTFDGFERFFFGSRTSSCPRWFKVSPRHAIGASHQLIGETNMSRLINKVALVTGASSGIGRATAKLFAAEGANVVIGARRQSELDSLVKEIEQAGGQAVALAGDVRSEAYAKALVDLAVTRFGQLDVAFNNAGTLGEAGASTEVSEAGWNETLAINLTGSFLGAKHQVAQMLKNGGGSVIFTSTFVGHSFAFPGVAAYAASKSGLIGLTQALAAEFGPQGVRVNAVLPGAVDTDMYRDMNNTAESQAFVTNLHALKRVATPEELARSVLYFASDDSAFVTGTASLVDGGASITRT